MVIGFLLSEMMACSLLCHSVGVQGTRIVSKVKQMLDAPETFSLLISTVMGQYWEMRFGVGSVVMVSQT